MNPTSEQLAEARRWVKAAGKEPLPGPFDFRFWSTPGPQHVPIEAFDRIKGGGDLCGFRTREDAVNALVNAVAQAMADGALKEKP